MNCSHLPTGMILQFTDCRNFSTRKWSRQLVGFVNNLIEQDLVSDAESQVLDCVIEMGWSHIREFGSRPLDSWQVNPLEAEADQALGISNVSNCGEDDRAVAWGALIVERMPVDGPQVVVQSVKLTLKGRNGLKDFESKSGLVVACGSGKVRRRPLWWPGTPVWVCDLGHLAFQLLHVVPHVAQFREPVELLKILKCFSECVIVCLFLSAANDRMTS